MMLATSLTLYLVISGWVWHVFGRDEEKIMKACYWPNEVYEPCFAGCAEISCDNPRNHLRPCYPFCEPGCICEDPYVRDDRTHQCVLPQDCTPTQMGIPVPTRRPPPAMAKRRGYAEGAPGRGPEEARRTDRTGNYFNIVIAPPLKPMQPRKLRHS